MLVHNVYFTLKDGSPQAVETLTAACERYLRQHPGVVFFACGSLAEGLERPVNDRDFHVGLHVVFGKRDDHDRYQEDPQHKKFIEENQDNWARVRVFDSMC